jgi:hypothetical protein
MGLRVCTPLRLKADPWSQLKGNPGWDAIPAGACHKGEALNDPKAAQRTSMLGPFGLVCLLPAEARPQVIIEPKTGLNDTAPSDRPGSLGWLRPRRVAPLFAGAF